MPWVTHYLKQSYSMFPGAQIPDKCLKVNRKLILDTSRIGRLSKLFLLGSFPLVCSRLKEELRLIGNKNIIYHISMSL
jgi:hypothetical protein